MNNLPYDQSNNELDAHLRSLDVHDLFIKYHNWTSRFIAPRVRQVHISATLKARLSSIEHKTALKQIIEDIEAGLDLNCYLSKGIQHAADVSGSGKKLNRRRDLDLLLTSWGLHHLHLSTRTMPDGFVERTGDLLFVVFKHDNAYLVDVMPHGSWSKEHLVRVMFKELEGAEIVHEAKRAKNLSWIPNEEERKQLRNNAINSPMEIDGTMVTISGGMTTAGTSIDATMDTNSLLKAITFFEGAWENRNKCLREAFSKDGVELPEVPEFEFNILGDHGPVIFDKKSKLLLKLL
ncbi:MAG: hypothetical protein L3J15_08780 [Devosiaceae bacterium]|nr:hypothetical protein [Devosiaceae bacterium]